MQCLPVGAITLGLGLALAADEPAVQKSPEPVKLVWPAGSTRQARPVASIGTESGAPGHLVRPFGVAVDGEDRVFVADPSQHVVVVYDRKAGTAVRWTGQAQYTLSGPVAVALDNTGRLFVTDAFLSRVVVFDRAGTAVAAFGKDQLKRPGTIAVDSRSGRIWIADVQDNRIHSFDLKTFAPGKSISGVKEQGQAGAVTLSPPFNLAVNSQGHLFVSDGWQCSVLVFTPDGSLLRRFGTECAGDWKHGRPNVIAVDAADRVYLASAEGSSLQIFSKDGKPAQLVSKLGLPTKTSVVRTGMAVDARGRIHVVEQANGDGRVQIYPQFRSQSSPEP